MGCDIHSFAEVKRNGKWEVVKNCFTLDDFDKMYSKTGKGDEPFGNRDYSVFGFLADVRNYSKCECVTGEPKGLPEDSEYLNTPLDEPVEFTYSYFSNGTAINNKDYYEKDVDCHSHSYITLKELLDFDYDKSFENRRFTKTTVNENGGVFIDGRSVADEGKGEIITYREHLGAWFFTHIEDLKLLGEPENVRVVFWFDN